MQGKFITAFYLGVHILGVPSSMFRVISMGILIQGMAVTGARPSVQHEDLRIH